MKTIQIDISKTKTLEEVALAAAYTAAKAEAGAPIFDRVATISDDTGLLSSFWIQMAGEVLDKLKAFIVNSSLSEEKLAISLELSAAYDDALTDSVIADLSAALAAGITARWFEISFPAKAPEWAQRAASLLSRAHTKLCHRLPPRRPQ